MMYRRSGAGGRPHCAYCAGCVIGPLLFRALAGPETCPTCQGNGIASAGHVVIISAGIVVRREDQCLACEGAFWVRAEGAHPTPPPDAA